MDESSGMELAFLVVVVLITLGYLMPSSAFLNNIAFLIAFAGSVYALRGTWAWATGRHIRLEDLWIVFMLIIPFMLFFSGGLGLFLKVLGSLVSLIITVVFAVAAGLFSVLTSLA